MKYLIVIVLSSFALGFQACSFSSEDMYEKGKTLMSEGKFRDALPYLNKAIDRDNGNYEALNARGVVYYELKEYTNALLDYEQALKLKPDYYRPYYNRALLKVAQNDAQGALKDYAEAIRLDARNAEIFVNRGQLLAAMGQADAALRDFDQAVSLDETNALALYNRGNILFQREDFKRAIDNFEKAVKKDTKFSKAFHALGIAQLMLQQKEVGCLNLKQADRLGYTSAKVALEQYCK
jgi:tetratricopeptide (TPR) repeat protein